ncbi:thiamine pyrophosphate-binding protein [Phytohabitans kaempferiae]|uniref:Thiamine pyrophosphate-binding protein n=1 Tax=Phytohabitans kaempferiae TaxID=1620943 RepID=A0ABV6MAB1_9ACTN
MRMTGGDALVRQLRLEGVTTIFGVPGVQLDHATDALARFGEIRYVMTRHEQGAAYMADGYARSSGEVGVCMVVPGPGLLNAMAALATAYSCSSPVLCISGQIPSDMIGRGYGILHEIPGQSDLLGSVTKWHRLARRPADIPALVHEAFRQLRGGRPRPVALEIPPDVLGASDDIELVTVPEPDDPRVVPDPALVRRAAGLLARAERPVIYTGWGVQNANAGEELRAVAEAVPAPVVMSRTGLGSLPDRHPLAASKLAGRQLMPDADVVLAVGSRFMGFGGKPLPVAAGAAVIQIDADPASMGPPRAPRVALHGDAKLTLAALHAALGATGPDRSGRDRDALAAAVTRARGWADDQVREVEPQYGFLRAIRSALPDDGILVSELTQVSYLVRVAFPFHLPRTNITPGYQGTLGYGLPTALGAKVANPGRAVVSLNGDGGFGWCLQELATARKYGIGVVSVVFNDSAYGNVRRTQRDQFAERYLGTDLVNPDFVALAGAFGLAASRVEGPDALADALRKAIAADEPTLIEVPVGEMPDAWHLLG